MMRVSRRYRCIAVEGRTSGAAFSMMEATSMETPPP
jgi:hypothetical protein